MEEKPGQGPGCEKRKQRDHQQPVMPVLQSTAGKGECRPREKDTLPPAERERAQCDVHVRGVLEVPDVPREPGGDEQPPATVLRTA